jgi:hypothetical protein
MACEALRIPIRGRRVAGNGGKCQPLLSRSSTPEYCQVTYRRGQPACRRHAAVPHHRRQPEVLPDDDDEQKVEVGQARGSADQPLLPLNQLQPTYVRCPEGKPSWFPDCFV